MSAATTTAPANGAKAITLTPLESLLSRPLASNGKSNEGEFWKYVYSRRAQIETRLPDRLKGQTDRLLAVAKSYIETSKSRDELLKCTVQSLEHCILQSAEFGFGLDGKHVYAVRYGTTATLMPSYVGMIAVARRVGVIKDARAVVVMPDDSFELHDINGEIGYTLRPSLSVSRSFASCLGVLTVIDHQHGRRIAWMSKADIERRKAVSKATYSGNPWSVWGEEMAAKTGLRHELKTFSDDPAMIALFDADDQHSDLSALLDKPANLPDAARTAYQSLESVAGVATTQQATSETAQETATTTGVNDVRPDAELLTEFCTRLAAAKEQIECQNLRREYTFADEAMAVEADARVMERKQEIKGR